MIRLFIILILYIIYGNFNLVINDIVIFSLINIAIFTFLKEKNIKIKDIFIFILSSFIFEVFVGLPILVGIVVLLIPLFLLNYIINNYNLSFLIKSIIILLLSFCTFYFFDKSVIFRLFNFQYFIILFIFIFTFLGLLNHGKK